VVVERLQDGAEQLVLLLRGRGLGVGVLLGARPPGGDEVAELERQRLPTDGAVGERAPELVAHLWVLDDSIEEDRDGGVGGAAEELEVGRRGDLDLDRAPGQ
jgi:hypothetical protein